MTANRWKTKSRRVAARRSRSQVRSCPRIEMLEGRTLLSYAFTPIIPPQVGVSGAQAYDINNLGTIVGSYRAAGGSHGFVKDYSGYTLVTAAPLGSTQTD